MNRIGPAGKPFDRKNVAHIARWEEILHFRTFRGWASIAGCGRMQSGSSDHLGEYHHRWRLYPGTCRYLTDQTVEPVVYRQLRLHDPSGASQRHHGGVGERWAVFGEQVVVGQQTTVARQAPRCWPDGRQPTRRRGHRGLSLWSRGTGLRAPVCHGNQVQLPGYLAPAVSGAYSVIDVRRSQHPRLR